MYKNFKFRNSHFIFSTRQMPIHTDYSNFVKVDKGADDDEGSGESDGADQVCIY